MVRENHQESNKIKENVIKTVAISIKKSLTIVLKSIRVVKTTTIVTIARSIPRTPDITVPIFNV